MQTHPALAAFALALAALLPATAQTAVQAGTPSATPAPQTNSTNAAGGEMKTYQNEALALSYRYPADMVDASATVGAAMEATLSQAPGATPDMTRCVSLPFSVMSAKAGLQLVLLVRVDAGCLKKTLKPADLDELTEGEVRGLTASGGHPQFSEPIRFTTGGHAAEMVRGTFTLPTGQPLHSLVACVLLKPDAACWQFLASSDAALNTLATFPVSLGGSTPAPVVPTNLLPH